MKRDKFHYPNYLPPCEKCGHKQCILAVLPECPQCNGWFEDEPTITLPGPLFELRLDSSLRCQVGHGHPSLYTDGENRVSAYLASNWDSYFGNRFWVAYSKLAYWFVEVWLDASLQSMLVRDSALPSLEQIRFVDV